MRTAICAGMFFCATMWTVIARAEVENVGVAKAVPPVLALSILEAVQNQAHTILLQSSRQTVVDSDIGLGAMQKKRGRWQFKHSRRVSGERAWHTWQVTSGFSAEEVFDEAIAPLADIEALFSCRGRDCGNPVQWANRVFNQRLLYGRDDLQRYAIYQLADGNYVLFYAAARTAQRQYFHMEIWTPE